jgi:hypothetical protein
MAVRPYLRYQQSSIRILLFMLPLLLPSASHAIPAFAREYGTNCATSAFSYQRHALLNAQISNKQCDPYCTFVWPAKGHSCQLESSDGAGSHWLDETTQNIYSFLTNR